MVLGKLDLQMQKIEIAWDEGRGLVYEILGLETSYNKTISRHDEATLTYHHSPWIPQEGSGTSYALTSYSSVFITVFIKYLYGAYFDCVPVTVLSALLKPSKQPVRQGLPL